MITLAVLLSLCADVTVTKSVTIYSDASIERLAGEAAVQLLPVALSAIAARGERAGVSPPMRRPNVYDVWLTIYLPRQLRYGYTATLRNRTVRRSTTIERHHVRLQATLLSGLPPNCRSATLILDAAELSDRRTRLVLTLQLQIYHRLDRCRLVRRVMCREGSAAASEKLAAIAAAGRRAVREGRSTIAEIEAAFAGR
jgi:hypothetical protein